MILIFQEFDISTGETGLNNNRCHNRVSTALRGVLNYSTNVPNAEPRYERNDSRNWIWITSSMRRQFDVLSSTCINLQDYVK